MVSRASSRALELAPVSSKVARQHFGSVAAMPQIRANGIGIEYESIGREGDPVILMINGYSTPLVGWPDSLCRGLAAKGFRVIRFDNRDIGRSTVLEELAAP